MGIGGIGMSGIAKVLAAQGYRISGCDLDLEQKSVKQLQKLGCTISHGHDSVACHDPSIDVVVYSTAVHTDHPELARTRAAGKRTIHRSVMLAELMRTKYSIAVSGAHGKTTTTSLIAHILLQTNQDPTVVIGGHLKNIDDNAHAGSGQLLVAEADESDRSFLRLPATWAVITNIDLEHLDTYKDLPDIIATFKQFLCQLPFYGKAIVCLDDPVIKSLFPLPDIATITYGLDDQATVYARDIELLAEHSTCTVYMRGEQLGKLMIPIAGRHHLLNALGATALALDVGLSFGDIAQALATFQGVERRFSYHGKFHGAEIFDDYGHHPCEIAHTLSVARKRAKGRVHVVFQPHRFTRTHLLWNDFIDTFMRSNIDTLVLTDIFPASEEAIEGVTSQRLVEDLAQRKPRFAATYIPLDSNFAQLIANVKEHAQPGDLVLFLGAGKVYQIPELLELE